MMRYNALFLIILLLACQQQETKPEEQGVNLSKVMGNNELTGFARATEPRDFIFPPDHGAHPEFRTEWWYFTGNVSTEDDRQFGYQFTIFRTALQPTEIQRSSEWASQQIYMAHFAVSDISENGFYYEERFSREGNNLAGAAAQPLKVWLEDWQITATNNSESFKLPELRIIANAQSFAIDFTVKALKPMVLQGDQGLSQKSSAAGNASYYYSYTRLATEGKIVINDNSYQVTGYSWLDREWSTSALGENQAGWDWFALQMDDSTEIMYYQMRTNEGVPDKYSKGVLVNKKGQKQAITVNDVTLTIQDYWLSASGARYPSGWQLEIPEKDIELNITPAIKDQELDVTVTYWEGTVYIEGTKNGKKIRGRGYVEMTGY